MNLADFIRAEVARPFQWGEADCASMADRWVRTVAGFSPLAVYGRSYGGPQEARAWLDEPGGIAVAVNRVMRASGFARTKEPRTGDVGLVFCKQQLCVAIHAGRLWLSRDEAGLLGAPLAACWKAWRPA